MEPCFLLGLFDMSWSQRKREVGFLGTFGMGWLMVLSLPLASDSSTSMWNHGRPTTITDAFYMDPYLFYEISVIDVPQSHPSFVPFVLCRNSVFNDTRSCVGQAEGLVGEPGGRGRQWH